MTKHNENNVYTESVDADWVAFVNDYGENPKLCHEARYCLSDPSRRKSISMEDWPEVETRIRRWQEIDRKWDLIDAELRAASNRRWEERRQKRILAGKQAERRPLEEAELKQLMEKALVEYEVMRGPRQKEIIVQGNK
jgi:hypothetical protein